MADSDKISAPKDLKLRGMINFVDWNREFRHVAKWEGVLDFLTGKKVIPAKPHPDDYTVKTTITKKPARKTTQRVTSGAEANDDNSVQALINQQQNINVIQYEFEYSEWKTAKEKIELAGRLLFAWVSGRIKIEIKDCDDAKAAYELIQKLHKPTDEGITEDLLDELQTVRCDEFPDLDAYVYKILSIQADLKEVKYPVTDKEVATAMVRGLPRPFKNFKENWYWPHAYQDNSAIDIDELVEMIYSAETMLAEKQAEEAKASSERRNSSGSDSSVSITPLKRQRIVCTFPGCPNPIGHTEYRCWNKNPEKMPHAVRKAREKQSNAANKPMAMGMTGLAIVDYQKFDELMSKAEKARR